jgi:hypothetical protein
MRRLSRFASFILFVSFLGAGQSAFAQTVTRGPYLQMANDDAITIRWRTSTATDSAVRYGASPTALSQNVTVSGSRTEHTVRVTGLSPDTLYYYSIGSSGATLAGGDSSYRFTTSPVSGTAVATRVWLIGDAGTANSSQTAVSNDCDAPVGTRRRHHRFALLTPAAHRHAGEWLQGFVHDAHREAQFGASGWRGRDDIGGRGDAVGRDAACAEGGCWRPGDHRRRRLAPTAPRPPGADRQRAHHRRRHRELLHHQHRDQGQDCRGAAEHRTSCR